jgi:hypothetical protein
MFIKSRKCHKKTVKVLIEGLSQNVGKYRKISWPSPCPLQSPEEKDKK